MSIATMDQLEAARQGGNNVQIQRSSVTSSGAFHYSTWGASGTPAAGNLTIGNTTTGAIPVAGGAGAPVIPPFTSGNKGYLSDFFASSPQTSMVALYDRVWHAGSISCLALATTTFSGQPAFTRVPNGGTNYVPLELWIEVNAAVSATATTVVVSYQDGNNVTQTATIDATLTGSTAARLIPMRLANGSGVMKVNSVTIGGTVATTGTINVVVMRRITTFLIANAGFPGEPRQDAFKLGLPEIHQTAALFLISEPSGAATGLLSCDFTIINA